MLDWESDRWPEWVEWVHSFIHDSAQPPEKAAEGITKLYTNIGMEIARRRKQLGDDLFSDMMRPPVNGKLLTDDELRDFAVLVLLGVERFEDCGSVYAVRHLPVTFTPGKRLPDT